MANYSLRCSSLFLSLVLVAAAGVPGAGAQGLSAADSAAINNLLGAGVLGPAVPAGASTTPTSLLPLTPATWQFQFAAGPNQGATRPTFCKPTPSRAPRRRGNTRPGRAPSTISAPPPTAASSAPASRICGRAC